MGHQQQGQQEIPLSKSFLEITLLLIIIINQNIRKPKKTRFEPKTPEKDKISVGNLTATDTAT
jgi:hypothetical protein